MDTAFDNTRPSTPPPAPSPAEPPSVKERRIALAKNNTTNIANNITAAIKWLDL
jgi:hypothetical protein